jgi:hypothetical protein
MKLILENWNNFVNEEEELEEAMAKDIKVEKLPNGFYRFYDYESQLSGLYNPDGTMRSGDLDLNKKFVQTKIAELTK